MSRGENTKERFMLEALKLFGEQGYESVKIAEIARQVGCTAPALYKHFENKQKLYEAIVEESIRGYEESMHRIRVDFSDHPERYISMTEAEQLMAARRLFLYPLRDPWASAFRKLMMTEQFHKKELAELYDKRYVHLQYEQHAALFRLLMEAGKMRQADAYAMAVMYVSPIIVLIGVCDRNPDKEAWALQVIEDHVKEFNRNYRI